MCVKEGERERSVCEREGGREREREREREGEGWTSDPKLDKRLSHPSLS